MKKALFAVVVVALLAAMAPAGEVKSHEWPCEFVPVELMQIPVLMDIGYWIRVKDQGDYHIHLSQESIHVYSGCVKVPVETNTKIELSVSITATGKVGGNYSAEVTENAIMDPPGATAKICAKLTDADLYSGGAVKGGQKDVKVATVILKVRPVPQT
jgi:hypothetical protein